MAVSCYRVKATLKAESPLHIGSGRRTGVIKHSFPFIPGSFLRGSVGVLLMRLVCRLDEPLVNHEECQFFDDCLYTRLFGEEFGKMSHVFFRYAYPLHLGCGGIFLPVAKTVSQCRNRQCKKVYDGFVPPEKCDVINCGSAVKAFRGFMCDRCGNLERHPVSMSRLTLTAIDRDRKSAAQIRGDGEEFGTLHVTELIERGSRFCLELVVHRDEADVLDRLGAVVSRGLVDEGVGGGKSRGLGKVGVEDLKMEEVSVADVEKRAEEIDGCEFLVRLVSPMILGGEMLGASALLEGARRAYSWVFREGKPKLPDISLEDKRVSVEMFGGWSLREERRRRLEPAISAGSVFRFSCGKDDEVFRRALAALELYALGRFKPHGCGQVIFERIR